MNHSLFRTSAYSSFVSPFFSRLFSTSTFSNSVGVGSLIVCSLAVCVQCLSAASIQRATRAASSQVMQFFFDLECHVWFESFLTLSHFSSAESSSTNKVASRDARMYLNTDAVCLQYLNCSRATCSWSSGTNSVPIAASNSAQFAAESLQLGNCTVTRQHQPPKRMMRG